MGGDGGISCKLLETKPDMDDFFVRDCIPDAEVDNTCDTHEGAEEGVVDEHHSTSYIPHTFSRFLRSAPVLLNSVIRTG